MTLIVAPSELPQYDPPPLPVEAQPGRERADLDRVRPRRAARLDDRDRVGAGVGGEDPAGALVEDDVDRAAAHPVLADGRELLEVDDRDDLGVRAGNVGEAPLRVHDDAFGARARGNLADEPRSSRAGGRHRAASLPALQAGQRENHRRSFRGPRGSDDRVGDRCEPIIRRSAGVQCALLLSVRRAYAPVTPILASFLSGSTIRHILGTYGYGAVFGLIGIESLGIPAPGETTLIVARCTRGRRTTCRSGS